MNDRHAERVAQTAVAIGHVKHRFARFFLVGLAADVVMLVMTEVPCRRVHFMHAIDTGGCPDGRADRINMQRSAIRRFIER